MLLSNVFASILSWVLVLGLAGFCVYEIIKLIQDIKNRKKKKKEKEE